uniref:Uncharacterized protein n=1 Tax=Arundo donax TaxID=35708 RepID=A0A0A9BPC3_ARUDO
MLRQVYLHLRRYPPIYCDCRRHLRFFLCCL